MAWLCLFLAGLFEIDWPVEFKLVQQGDWCRRHVFGGRVFF